MNWNKLYRFKSYLRQSLWVVPFIAIPSALVASSLLHRLDAGLGWTLLGFGVSGVQAFLQAIVSATVSFVVFTFGSMLVAIQVASAQMTPRIIATTLLRNNVVKYAVGLFIFTLMFALSAQNRMESDVHQLVIFVLLLLSIVCFGAFLYLIDYASRLLRPISILSHVGDDGLMVIEDMYPEPSLGPDVAERENLKLGQPDRIISHLGVSGIAMAINLQLLMAEAERTDCVIEFAPQMGDFVAVDEPLFYLYGGARSVRDETLRASVAFGSERTLEQDPTFAFRIAVDIALRALSAAINDPTTAVLAIDQLHRMLRLVGKRHLRTDEIPAASGQLRVIFRTPNWEDFVHLAFREIRSCGSSNFQIVRRLRAMIDNLLRTLPPHRHAALQQELRLLDREIERNFRYPEDLALARIADFSGVGRALWNCRTLMVE